MQALELRIPGQYWDSFLYDDRLYLFTRDGGIETYSWDRLVAGMGWSADQRPIATQFLTRGKAWYASGMQQLLRSPATRTHFHEVIETLSGHRALSRAQLQKLQLAATDAALFPHNDIEVYYNTLNIAGTGGLVTSPLSATHLDFRQVADVPALRLTGSYGTLAIAAGSEGLWELPVVRDWPDDRELRQLASQNCQDCSWARFDIVANAGLSEAGYVAAFANRARPEEQRVDRSLLGLIDSTTLFGRAGYILGANDRILLIGNKVVEASFWNPYKRTASNSWDVLAAQGGRDEASFSSSGAAVVDATATVFGVVTETDSSLVVHGSDGATKRLGAPINWRCFTRSERYLNQLHVVYSDHLRVYAFTHDYFLSAPERQLAGTRPNREPW